MEIIILQISLEKILHDQYSFKTLDEFLKDNLIAMAYFDMEFYLN